jgi:hypothetical protein
MWRTVYFALFDWQMSVWFCFASYLSHFLFDSMFVHSLFLTNISSILCITVITTYVYTCGLFMHFSLFLHTSWWEHLSPFWFLPLFLLSIHFHLDRHRIHSDSIMTVLLPFFHLYLQTEYTSLLWKLNTGIVKHYSTHIFTLFIVY